MGFCGSAGAGLEASANAPFMNLSSESLSTAATPDIYQGNEERSSEGQTGPRHRRLNTQVSKQALSLPEAFI